MEFFTVSSNRVPLYDTEDGIMAGSAGHGVGSSVRYQDDVVVSQPGVNRVCPRAVVEDEVGHRPAEDHIGAGTPIDPVLPGPTVDGVGPQTTEQNVMLGAAADGVVAAIRQDLIRPRPPKM
jgi:hypothetical protein